MKFPIRLIISALIIGALVRHIGTGALLDTFTHVHLSAWGAALILLLVQILSLTFRWADLLNLGRNAVSYGSCLRMTVAAQLANTLFITAIGGAVVRVGLAAQAGISMPRAIGAAVMDRLMTVTALLILAALTLPAFSKLHYSPVLALWVPVAVAISALSFVLTVFILRGRIATALSRGKIKDAIAYMREMTGNLPLMARVLAISLAAQILYFTAVYCLVRSVGIDVGFSSLLSVLPVIALVASLPLSIGGWGVREGAFVFGLGFLGIPMDQAFLISVQIGIVCLLASVIVALPALFSADLRHSLLRHSLLRHEQTR
jgi:uncharacterized membrane protein YbhN (UPF0104 family)